MGRHFSVLSAVILLVGLVAASCGITPENEPIAGSDAGDPCPAVVRVEPTELVVGEVMSSSVSAANHVLCPGAFETSPPMSGDHFPAWQNCGFYDRAVRDETATHSLEHGAVWIAYDPDLETAMVDEIRALTQTDDHFLAAPYPGLKNPIVLSAWQRQVAVDTISDPAVASFVADQLGRVSKTAPEAGVSCEGGVGEPGGDPDLQYAEAYEYYRSQ